MEYGFDYRKIREFIEEAASHYSKQKPEPAPLLDWLDDVYIRLAEKPEELSVRELMQVFRLHECGEWEQQAYAVNRAFKAVRSTGRREHECLAGF